MPETPRICALPGCEHVIGSCPHGVRNARSDATFCSRTCKDAARKRKRRRDARVSAWRAKFGEAVAPESASALDELPERPGSRRQHTATGEDSQLSLIIHTRENAVQGAINTALRRLREDYRDVLSIAGQSQAAGSLSGQRSISRRIAEYHDARSLIESLAADFTTAHRILRDPDGHSGEVLGDARELLLDAYAELSELGILTIRRRTRSDGSSAESGPDEQDAGQESGALRDNLMLQQAIDAVRDKYRRIARGELEDAGPGKLNPHRVDLLEQQLRNKGLILPELVRVNVEMQAAIKTLVSKHEHAQSLGRAAQSGPAQQIRARERQKGLRNLAGFASDRYGSRVKVNVSSGRSTSDIWRF